LARKKRFAGCVTAFFREILPVPGLYVISGGYFFTYPGVLMAKRFTAEDMRKQRKKGGETYR
jgi:hypothetical protein